MASVVFLIWLQFHINPLQTVFCGSLSKIICIMFGASSSEAVAEKHDLCKSNTKHNHVLSAYLLLLKCVVWWETFTLANSSMSYVLHVSVQSYTHISVPVSDASATLCRCKHLLLLFNPVPESVLGTWGKRVCLIQQFDQEMKSHEKVWVKTAHVLQALSLWGLDSSHHSCYSPTYRHRAGNVKLWQTSQPCVAATSEEQLRAFHNFTPWKHSITNI